MGTDTGRCTPAPRRAALPRRIAVVSLSAGATCADEGANETAAARACRLILDDLARACRVYSAHDTAPDQPAPVVERIELSAAACAEDDRLRGADTWVVGMGADEADRDGARRERLEACLRAAGSTQARVYAVITCAGDGPQAAMRTLDALAARAQAAGTRPCGGLAVPRAHKVVAAFPTARMGHRRRRLSEATDRLILAVRCGQDTGTHAVEPSALGNLVHRIGRIARC